MVGKLLLPFPLLSDPRGDLIKRYGLWDEEEGVARPSIIVVDRSREIRYLYSGSDFADRPTDAEVFTALEGIDGSIKRVMGNPEIRISAEEARRDSVRPDKAPRTLDNLIPYYRGAYFTTVALKKRFARWGRSGQEAFREVGRYQTIVQGYRKALEQTVELQRTE
jgi:AhpC/TSA family